MKIKDIPYFCIGLIVCIYVWFIYVKPMIFQLAFNGHIEEKEVE